MARRQQQPFTVLVPLPSRGRVNQSMLDFLPKSCQEGNTVTKTTFHQICRQQWNDSFQRKFKVQLHENRDWTLGRRNYQILFTSTKSYINFDNCNGIEVFLPIQVNHLLSLIEVFFPLHHIPFPLVLAFFLDSLSFPSISTVV